MYRNQSPKRPHVDHLQRRQLDTTPRRRATDHGPRRRKGDQQGTNSPLSIFITVAFATLFLVDLFNFKRFANGTEHLLSSLVAVAHQEAAEAVALSATLLPLLGLFIGTLILVVLVRRVNRNGRASRRSDMPAGRQVITQEHFREIAAARGIQPRVAASAYTLLQPHYNRNMRARFDDSLRGELQMTRTEIVNLLGSLLVKTERFAPVDEAYEITTVIDLLDCVQRAPRKYLDEAAFTANMAARGSSVASFNLPLA